MTMHKLATLNLAPLTLAALLLLSACGGEAEVSTENDGREASGEVLEGSISDAMLPTDQVRSQAPQRAPDPAAPASGDSDAAAGEEGEAGAEAAEAAPAAEAAEPAE